MTEETFRFQVDRIIPESPRVKSFRLRPEGSGLPFHFSPGQHLGVRPAPPGVPDTEHEKWRHSSLSSSPSEDFLEITPPEHIKSATIDTYDDHRIAMCFSLAALGDVPITINDPDCVSKTFPDYFERLDEITQ